MHFVVTCSSGLGLLPHAQEVEGGVGRDVGLLLAWHGVAACNNNQSERAEVGLEQSREH